MENRKATAGKTSPLPADYLKLVNEVFANNFEENLKALARVNPAPARFSASGEIRVDEIILAVSLMHEGQLAATTTYASVDFDPRASTPTLQDLLAACLDAIGTVFGSLMDVNDEAALQAISDQSLSSLENVPFNWTQVEANRVRIWVKLDKSNPNMDRAADEWLAKHDPDAQAAEAEEHSETEKLFVTGPKDRKLH